MVREFPTMTEVKKIEFDVNTSYVGDRENMLFNFRIGKNKEIYLNSYSATLQKKDSIETIGNNQKQLSKLNVDYSQDMYYVNIQYEMQNGKSIYRGYNLKMNTKNHDYLQKLMEQFQNTDKFYYSEYDDNY